MDLFTLVDTLLDDTKWPTYTNRTILSQLRDWADEAYERDTFDGYLSYVLISHQVCEDYVILLLRHAQLSVRLDTASRTPCWSDSADGSPKAEMFGRVLRRLESSIGFDGKDEFIEACRKQNKIRNRLAHRLIGGIDLDEIRLLAQEYKNGNREVVDSFNDADEHFSYSYCILALDPVWDQILSTQVGDQTDPEEKRKWEVIQNRLEHQRVISPLRRIPT